MSSEQLPVAGEIQTDPEANLPKSGVISSVLSPAVRLWLRSQLDQVEDLHLVIEAGDRQILSGAIRRVSIQARRAVYQGLHFSQVELAGEQIRTNLRQVVRGKALRLLEAFPVNGTIQLSEADLNTSLQSPLLAQAVTDFLSALLKSDFADEATIVLTQPHASLATGQITLVANLQSANGESSPVAIRTGLLVDQGHQLKLDRPQLLPHAKARQGLPLKDLDGFTIDLGPHVSLQALSLEADKIVCQGQIMVTPVD